MLVDFGLKQIQLEFIQNLFATNQLLPEQVVVYGSRAKGNYSVESDLDLAIMGLSDTTLLGQLNELLNESYELPFKVDLVLFETITNPQLKQEIMQHGRPLINSISA